MSNPIIKIHYIINENESSIAFNSLNKLSVFKNVLAITQKINIDNYDIFYNKINLSNLEDKPIHEIINKDQIPVFKLVKKSSK